MPAPNTRNKRLAVMPALATVVSLFLTSCGGDAGNAHKAGAGVVPQTVVLATADSQGNPTSDHVLHFARTVKELSRGAITIDVRWRAFDPASGPNDQQPYATVAALVDSGEAELALIPDFVWIDRGARKLAALKVPFLVANEAEVNRIAKSSLAEDMLAELAQFGVHGLALLPESLVHPVGFGRALASLSDFDGATLRTLDSQTAALFRQWGARVSHVNGVDYPRAVHAGRVRGADAAFAPVSLPVAGVFTGDITLFPRVNALVASAGWFGSLDPRSREAVSTAARHTLDHVVATNPSDAELAAEHCAVHGGSVVLAGREAVTELERAAQPLTAALLADVRTRPTIDAIVELIAGVAEPAKRLAACQSSVSPPRKPPDIAGDESAAFPEGTYRMEISEQTFLDGGVDAGTAAAHVGVWTIIFRDGRFDGVGCPGSTYVVSGDRVWVTLGHDAQECGDPAGHLLFSARWTYSGGVLRFLDVRSEAEGPLWQPLHETLWGSTPWQRIN